MKTSIKNIFILVCLSLSVTAFSETNRDFNKDARVGRPNNVPPAEKEFKDTVVRGQSATDRRTYPPGSLQEVNQGSINGTNCVTSTGTVVRPQSKEYRTCVDNANRIK